MSGPISAPTDAPPPYSSLYPDSPQDGVYSAVPPPSFQHAQQAYPHQPAPQFQYPPQQSAQQLQTPVVFHTVGESKSALPLGPALAVAAPIQTVALLPQKPSDVRARCGTRLETVAGKEEREYSFTLILDGQHIHVTPFESFQQIRDRFAVARGLEQKQQRQPFPHRYRFAVLSDYIHNTANVAERCAALEKYADNLLSKDLSPATLKQFQISPGPVFDRLSQIEQQRIAFARYEQTQEQARLHAIRQKQLADADFVEHFQRLWVPAPGQISTIAYPQNMSFVLRNRLFGCGDASIKGPGDLVYFRLERTNESFFRFRECQFQIASAKGQPLLMMQEKFAWMDYKYDLSRIGSDGKLIPVCQVRRHWQLFAFTDHYTIMLYGPMSHHPPITCTGAWPHEFSLTANGRLCAQVSKQLMTFTDTYNLTVHANEDCLLFVGIACAIDRIHHEVQHNKK